MNSAFGVLTGQGLKRDLRQLCGTGRWILSLIGVALLLLFVPLTHAQTTAQLTGTVQDATGGVIPGAQVTLTESDILVRYQKRAHNPLLIAAGYDTTETRIPWLGRKRLQLVFG